MSFAPILALCLLATLVVDLLVAALRFARSELFWPSAFCLSLAGLSAAFMWLAFLDFDATAPIYATLALLGAAAAASLVPAIRSMA